MPVTKSAKKALRTATRRKAENVLRKETYRQAIKQVKKAVEAATGNASELFAQAQSALDRAAKSKTIHPNKAARLKSRLSKKLTGDGLVTVAKPKKTTVKPKAKAKAKTVAKKK